MRTFDSVYATKMGGSGKRMRIVPEAVETVGKMVEHGIEVRACCRKCEITLEVSPELMMRAHGPDHSLVGRVSRCPVLRCGGELFYMCHVQGRWMPMFYS